MEAKEMDENFWKNAYHQTWSDASERERGLIEMIQKVTGADVIENGLGTGSNNFINGNAASNGYQKGDPDLRVKGTDIYIEVTGPLSTNISVLAPLWFRPDKLNNAIKNMSAHDTFLAHHCPSLNLWRVIHIDVQFSERCYNHEFKVVHPSIRGNTERYVEIPADDKCIRDIGYLMCYIKKNT